MTTKEILNSIDIPHRKLSNTAFIVGFIIIIISKWLPEPWRYCGYVGVLLIVTSFVYIGARMYKAGYKSRGVVISILAVISGLIYIYLLNTFYPIKL